MSEESPRAKVAEEVGYVSEIALPENIGVMSLGSTSKQDNEYLLFSGSSDKKRVSNAFGAASNRRVTFLVCKASAVNR